MYGFNYLHRKRSVRVRTALSPHYQSYLSRVDKQTSIPQNTKYKINTSSPFAIAAIKKQCKAASGTHLHTNICILKSNRSNQSVTPSTYQLSIARTTIRRGVEETEEEKKEERMLLLRNFELSIGWTKVDEARKHGDEFGVRSCEWVLTYVEQRRETESHQLFISRKNVAVASFSWLPASSFCSCLTRSSLSVVPRQLNWCNRFWSKSLSTFMLRSVARSMPHIMQLTRTYGPVGTRSLCILSSDL